MGPRGNYRRTEVDYFDPDLGEKVIARADMLPNPAVHHNCLNRENCNGPGCIVRTGKTERKSRRHVRGN